MHKDEVKGGAKQARGAVKDAVGKATGDRKLQADGKADKVEGKVQQECRQGQGSRARRPEKVARTDRPVRRRRSPDAADEKAAHRGGLLLLRVSGVGSAP